MWHVGSVAVAQRIFLVVACELLVGHMGSTSLTRDRTQAPCFGSMES